MRKALVLAAVREKHILTYYTGDGEWGFEDNAKVFFPGSDLEVGWEEAEGHLPEEATELGAFRVYVR